MTVVWGDDYWDQATALDGGSGLLHRQLRSVRDALAMVPFLGDPIWDSEGKYGLRAVALDPVLRVRIGYVIIGDFVVLLEVEVIDDYPAPTEDAG